MSTEGSAGKRVRSNAGKAAIAAGAFALGAGATAGATALIDGHAIKPGSIPLNRLTRSAQRELKGARGPRGGQRCERVGRRGG